MFVTLYPLKKGIYLIIEDINSPVIYGNQTKGVLCAHLEMRGFLVPVQLEEETEAKFYDFNYKDVKHEVLLKQLSDFFHGEIVFSLNGGMAAKSGEAWLYLTGERAKPEAVTSIVKGFPDSFNAILTWPNSD